MAALYGSSTQSGATDPTPNVLDLDLTLTISDGTTTRDLPAHVHTCGDIRFTLVPCFR
jgi:hypothetical protein